MKIKEDIMVSILCTVYNHEWNLKACLQAFVDQIVDFNIEVLIHDDCSTDKSVEIIKEYELKYPGIVKPIYQRENQFSKKVPIIETFLYPKAKGKYIAICEGDDLWTDKYKLQKQVDYLEMHPECTFCYTNATIMNVKNGKSRVFVPFKKNEQRFINSSGIYNAGELSFFSFIPTCSFVFPRKNIEKYPEYYNGWCFGGDRKISLYATSLGYAYFLNEVTCCYHYAVDGSAMTRKKSKRQMFDEERSYVTLYRNINEFTVGRFSERFEMDYLRRLKKMYALNDDISLFSSQELEYIKNNYTFVDKVKKVIISLLSEQGFNFLRALKRKFM